MAKPGIGLAPEEQAQVHLLRPGPAFITDGGEMFEIPDLPEDLGRACALASEPTLKKFWDTKESDALVIGS